ncbi:unnamed protein product [Hymenolepis diminuta]|uniref:Craniofacial development protein 2-like n=1 Tax=Hymenolepis diminuta TaxID=6216 RepID=A0A0R3SGY4_HYMDI|nr:unnamed protein product [Hymenolepis diminuta]
MDPKSYRMGGHVSHNFSEIVLKCGLWNIRTCSSDGKKLNGIFSELSSRNYKFTVLTETWQGNGQIELSSQYTIYNSGFVIDGEFTGGVAFLVDTILAPKRSELYVTDARASRSVTTSSDHVLLTVILRHSFKRQITPRKGKSKLEVRRSVPIEIQPQVSSTPIVISEPILPKRTNRQKNKPWFLEVKEKLVPELLEKHRLRKQWLLDQLPESFEAFKKQRNRVANQIRCAKMQYEKKMEREQEKSIELP